MAKLTTTLARIKANNPCKDGLEQLLEHLGSDYPDDKEIDLLTILESNGIHHFFWAFRTVENEKLVNRLAVELAIKFAERVLPIFEKEYPNNDIPRKAIEFAKAWLKHGEKVDSFPWSLADIVKAGSTTQLAAQGVLLTVSYASKLETSEAALTAVWVADLAVEASATRVDERQVQIEIIKEVLA